MAAGRWTWAAAALAALAALIAGTARAGDVSLPHDLTIFTVASNVQFINTADDRARGATNNPFDAATNKLKPRGANGGSGDGPFPGDIVVFSFELYAKLPLKSKIGSASYTCYFNYARHALCQAYYQLHGGTLTAAGPVDFNTSDFELVITGGTKAFLAARGEVTSVQAHDNAQRVHFQLLD